jgi:hypothetical protein
MQNTGLKKGHMTEREKHIAHTFTAELQFRLASAVRLATVLGIQPLDLPIEWTHGKHVVKYEEIALRPDQADYAAHFLHNSATLLLAVAIKDAIRAVVQDPKTSKDPNVQAAYQIARLIRNAFAHGPFAPTWSIDPDCRDHVFQIRNIIRLDTKNLQGTPFHWSHYGGPLALFRLCRFVRIHILKDKPSPRKSVPLPRKRITQLGELILQQIDKIPAGATLVKTKPLPDGSIHLGGGYYIRPTPAEKHQNTDKTAPPSSGA